MQQTQSILVDLKDYRSSEGREVLVPYRGAVAEQYRTCSEVFDRLVHTQAL